MNLKNLIFRTLIFSILSSMSVAASSHFLTLSGRIQSFDQKYVQFKQKEGQFKIPRSFFKKEQVVSGTQVELQIDKTQLIEIQELNSK